MLLLTIRILPLAAGLLCLAVRSRPWQEGLNLTAFIATAVLTAVLAREILWQGVVSGLGGFLRAGALTPLVAPLIPVLALLSGIFAIRYFREDELPPKLPPRHLRGLFLPIHH